MEKRRITIHVGGEVLTARLNESETAARIWEALPFEAQGTRWGEEIYFEIPVDISVAEDARQEMAIGELAYWPQGHAFCIFFGPTPVSRADEPRAYTDVNPFGQIEDDVESLRGVADGAPVIVTRREN
jgi:hypothetical protein